MKKILILLFISISILGLAQEEINDGYKNFNHYDFCDSIQFFWPNGNPKYKFINIHNEYRLGRVNRFTNELFYSQKTGELMKGNKFRRKYGMSTIIGLRDSAHIYFTSKEREIKAKNRELLKNKFHQKNNLNYSVLDILKTLLVDSTNIDTIKIKHGLLLDLGRVHFYTRITRIDTAIFIKNFTEEIHYEKVSQDSSILVQNLILDSECKIPIDKMLDLIKTEKEKCWLTDNKIDYRWTFQFNSGELKDQEIKDFFGYHLNYFFDELVCK